MVRPSEKNDYGEWIPHIEGKKTLDPLTEFEYDEWEKMKEMKTYIATITETFVKQILVKAPNKEEADRLLDAAHCGELHQKSCDKVEFDYYEPCTERCVSIDGEVTDSEIKNTYLGFYDVLELDPEEDDFKWKKSHKFLIHDIDWDTEGEDVDLPTEVEYESDTDDEEEVLDSIADYLSDKYGWLVNSFYVKGI